MPASFDPYHKWLGISPKDQPPHHYRLLGIELFEDDAEVIEAAANRLMAYLHDVAAGDATGDSQKLLNEISAARICLLNKQRKAAYDQQLQAVSRHSAPEQPGIPAPPTPGRPSSRPSSRPQKPPPIAAGASGPPARAQGQRAALAWRVGGATIALGAIVAVVLIGRSTFWSADDAVEPAESTASTSTKTTLGRQALLLLDWPATQRNEALLLINGVQQELPTTADMKIPLDAGALELRISRPGYVDIVWTVPVARGEYLRYSPVWEPIESQVVDAPTDAVPSQRAAAKNLMPPPRTHADNAVAAPQPKVISPAENVVEAPSAAKEPSDVIAFHSIPKFLPIPMLADDQTASSPWTTIIPVARDAVLGLRLLGGESLLKSGAFQLTRRRDEPHKQRWTVDYVDRKQVRTEVATFAVIDAGLAFRWQSEASTLPAKQLRNAMLGLEAGKQSLLLPLRSPTIVPPLAIDGAKGRGRIDVRVDTLPDLTTLKLVLTRATGDMAPDKPFENQSASPKEPLTVDVGAPEKDFPLEIEVSFDVPRAGARVIHFQYQLRYRSNAGLLVNWSRVGVVQDALLARQAGNRLAKAGNQQQRERLLRNVDYFNELESLARGKSQLQLHFRIEIPIEHSQVVLAETNDATGQPIHSTRQK